MSTNQQNIETEADGKVETAELITDWEQVRPGGAEAEEQNRLMAQTNKEKH